KIIIITTICIVALLVILGISSFEKGNSSNKISAAVIVGVHSNSNEIPMNSSSLDEVLLGVCSSYGQISIIGCDGSPQLYYQAEIPIPSVSGLSQQKEMTIASDYSKQLKVIVAKVEATYPEVDTHKAIMLAGKALRNADKGDQKMLFIMDSGLSTKGYIDFTDGLITKCPEDIVEALRNADAIPDLKGIHVYWAFLGETAYPQEDLSLRQKINLKNIWTAVLEAAGAESITFTDDFTTQNPYSGLPYVSVIKAEDKAIEVDSPPENDNQPIETIVLGSTSVAFIGDSDQFVDANAAKKEISLISEILLKNPAIRVYVVGTTASGSELYTQQLSEARAITVEMALIELGVDVERLIPVGLGFKDHWHLEDRDSNGIMIESIASQNRKVMIIDVNSKDAEHVKTFVEGEAHE
ncbi:MAG: OmpA family protein, partial [Bacteroidales bacterium]|nr:OmpA family protein [Bacteroidales bacterium]